MDWLTALDPKAVQGLFTLVGVLVASGTALYIALWVYPEQKEIDRRNELRRERRSLYGAFLRELIEMQLLLENVGLHSGSDVSPASSIGLEKNEKLRARYASVFGSLQVLALTSSPTVYSASSKCFSNLSAVFRQTQISWAWTQAKRGEDVADLAPDKGHVVSVLSTASIKEFDDAVWQVWLTMRAEEFVGTSYDVDYAAVL